MRIKELQLKDYRNYESCSFMPCEGVTVLLVEQNANMALKIADQAYVLETGNITMSGSGAELLVNEKVREAYLGKNG